MADILFINACVRENSRTLKLARHALGQMSGNIEEVDIYKTPIAMLDNAGMAKRDSAAKSGDFSDPFFDLAKQFSLADTVVIAAPFWDLMFPAALKTYLEAVTVAGVTFRYSPMGMPVGMCRARRLVYITTAGGFIGDNDFGFSYIKTMAQKFYGIDDVVCFKAEGLDAMPEKAESFIEKAKADIDSTLCM